MIAFVRPLAAVIVLVTCSSFALAADEGDNEVKPPAYWVERLASDDPEIRNAAHRALLRTYDEIFESPLFDDDDELAEREAFRAALKPLAKQLVKLLDGKHDDSRVSAAYLLAVIGPDAAEAEPLLLKFIRSKDTSGGLQMAAITALLHVTPRNRAVLPTLLEVGGSALEKRPEAERPDAIRRDEEHEEASAGISATAVALMLVQSGRTAIEIPTLLGLTTDRYRRGIRLTVIYALAELGGEAIAAVPQLRKLLRDEDRRIRSAAGWALLRIEESPAGLPDVLKAMELDEKERAEFQKSVSEFFKERELVVGSLRDDDEIREYIPMLLRQLGNGNAFYQRQAIRYLGEVGPAAKPAVLALLKAAGSDDKFTRDTAIAALKRIDPSAVPTP
jgi:HEAT repeat protein